MEKTISRYEDALSASESNIKSTKQEHDKLRIESHDSFAQREVILREELDSRLEARIKAKEEEQQAIIDQHERLVEKMRNEAEKRHLDHKEEFNGVLEMKLKSEEDKHRTLVTEHERALALCKEQAEERHRALKEHHDIVLSSHKEALVAADEKYRVFSEQHERSLKAAADKQSATESEAEQRLQMTIKAQEERQQALIDQHQKILESLRAESDERHRTLKDEHSALLDEKLKAAEEKHATMVREHESALTLHKQEAEERHRKLKEHHEHDLEAHKSRHEAAFTHHKSTLEETVSHLQKRLEEYSDQLLRAEEHKRGLIEKHNETLGAANNDAEERYTALHEKFLALTAAKHDPVMLSRLQDAESRIESLLETHAQTLEAKETEAEERLALLKQERDDMLEERRREAEEMLRDKLKAETELETRVKAKEEEQQRLIETHERLLEQLRADADEKHNHLRTSLEREHSSILDSKLVSAEATHNAMVKEHEAHLLLNKREHEDRAAAIAREAEQIRKDAEGHQMTISSLQQDLDNAISKAEREVSTLKAEHSDALRAVHEEAKERERQLKEKYELDLQLQLTEASQSLVREEREMEQDSARNVSEQQVMQQAIVDIDVHRRERAEDKEKYESLSREYDALKLMVEELKLENNTLLSAATAEADTIQFQSQSTVNTITNERQRYDLLFTKYQNAVKEVDELRKENMSLMDRVSALSMNTSMSPLLTPTKNSQDHADAAGERLYRRHELDTLHTLISGMKEREKQYIIEIDSQKESIRQLENIVDKQSRKLSTPPLPSPRAHTPTQAELLLVEERDEYERITRELSSEKHHRAVLQQTITALEGKLLNESVQQVDSSLLVETHGGSIKESSKASGDEDGEMDTPMRAEAKEYELKLNLATIEARYNTLQSIVDVYKNALMDLYGSRGNYDDHTMEQGREGWLEGELGALSNSFNVQVSILSKEIEELREREFRARASFGLMRKKFASIVNELSEAKYALNRKSSSSSSHSDDNSMTATELNKNVTDMDSVKHALKFIRKNLEAASIDTQKLSVQLHTERSNSKVRHYSLVSEMNRVLRDRERLQRIVNKLMTSPYKDQVLDSLNDDGHQSHQMITRTSNANSRSGTPTSFMKNFFGASGSPGSDMASPLQTPYYKYNYNDIPPYRERHEEDDSERRQALVDRLLQKHMGLQSDLERIEQGKHSTARTRGLHSHSHKTTGLSTREHGYRGTANRDAQGEHNNSTFPVRPTPHHVDLSKPVTHVYDNAKAHYSHYSQHTPEHVPHHASTWAHTQISKSASSSPEVVQPIYKGKVPKIHPDRDTKFAETHPKPFIVKHTPRVATTRTPGSKR